MEKIVKNIIEEQNDENIAITSVESPPLSYRDLNILINNISRQLSANGISNKDRAAIVLPNGPYMATSFLAISSYMSAAPLNPKYKSEEFEFYLSDLKPKLLIVDHNSKNPAVDVANKLKIPVCEIKKQKDAPSGFFNLFENNKDFNLPKEENEALVLHTSGTTSRPKIVPLSNKNIFASSINISSSLELTEKDH